MKKFLPIFLTCPWILLSTGSIVHLNNLFLFLYTLFVASLIFLTNWFFLKGKRIKLAEEQKSDAFKGFDFILVSIYVIVFIYLITKNFQLLFSVGFNPQFARNLFFDNEKIKEIWGNIYLRMIYTNILLPVFYLYLLNKRMYKFFDFILIVLFLISGLLVGSRFSLYFIFVIFFISRLTTSKYNYKSKNLIYLGIIFLVLVFGISLIRTYMSYDLGFSQSIKSSIVSIYNYHSIQLGVYSFYSKSPLGFGPFTGLFTPVYMLLGKSSVESDIYTYLNNVSFLDKGYNAFGTSAFFFNFSGYLGFIFFVFFFNIFSFFFYFKTHSSFRLLFIRFSIFSLFFSAFQPFVFTFSWWFIMFYFMIITYKIKIKKINTN